MIKRISTAILLFSTVLFVNAEDQILSNSGFEMGLKGWKTPSWRKNTLIPEIDQAVIQGPGSASLRIKGVMGKSGFVMQRMKMDAGNKKFKISGWIKTLNFTNNWSACITVECVVIEEGKEKFNYFSLITPWKLSNTKWTKYEKTFETPANTKYIGVILQTKNSSPLSKKSNLGTAWFDNISLQEINKNNKDLSK